jgi:hypothetical protein
MIATTTVLPAPLLPEPTPTDLSFDALHRADVRYRCRLQAFCAELAGSRGLTDRHTGKSLHFPCVAGYARYVIVCLGPSPVLVHDASGDALELPYLHRLTGDDLLAELERCDADREHWAKLEGLTHEL